MRPTEPSRTSILAAIARGLHRETHDRPWILDDPFALQLAGPDWEALYEAISAVVSEPLLERAVAAICARARVAEDRLSNGFSQYLLLGAGLDSFAWRQRDLLGSLRVIEVDHPATQAWKVVRTSELSLPIADSHVFAPVDFENQTLAEGLDSAGVDTGTRTLISCLGVFPYLTWDAIDATLEAVTRFVPGSQIVFSYCPNREYFDEMGVEYFDLLTRIAGASGEPIQNQCSPGEMEARVSAAGLTVEEHLSPADLADRYCAGRSDGLKPYTIERVLCASVPG